MTLYFWLQDKSSNEMNLGTRVRAHSFHIYIEFFDFETYGIDTWPRRKIFVCNLSSIVIQLHLLLYFIGINQIIIHLFLFYRYSLDFCFISILFFACTSPCSSVAVELHWEQSVKCHLRHYCDIQYVYCTLTFLTMLSRKHRKSETVKVKVRIAITVKDDKRQFSKLNSHDWPRYIEFFKNKT